MWITINSSFKPFISQHSPRSQSPTPSGSQDLTRISSPSIPQENHRSLAIIPLLITARRLIEPPDRRLAIFP